MGDSEEMSRANIPDVEAIKTAALQVLASGRSRSLVSWEKETAKQLGLSPKQQIYHIAGSTTALFANRFEKARSELHRDRLIEYPARGKVRLIDVHRFVEGEKSAASVGDESSADDGQPVVIPIAATAEPQKPGSFDGGIVEFPSEEKSTSPMRPWLPLVLAVIGLILCFTGTFAIVGVV